MQKTNLLRIALCAAVSGCGVEESRAAPVGVTKTPLSREAGEASAGRGGRTEIGLSAERGAKVPVAGSDRLQGVGSAWCEEPPESDEAPDAQSTLAAPAVELEPAALTAGGSQLAFHPEAARAGYVQVVTPLASTRGTSLTLTRAAQRVRVETRAGAGARAEGEEEDVTLLAPSDDLGSLELLTTYLVQDGQLAVQKLVLRDAASGQVVDHADGGLRFTDVPGSCEEQAIVAFGPLPAGMPSFAFPDNAGCDGLRCVQTRLAYLHSVHDTWRITQMFAILAGTDEPQRSFYWGQPGLTQDGEATGQRTSPEYWFGGYDAGRFWRIKDMFDRHLAVLRSATMGGVKLHLKCPNAADNGANACITGNAYAHHHVKGYVNICPRTWSDLDISFDDDGDGWWAWFVHIVGHEFYHHQWVEYPPALVNWRLLSDRQTHWHGGSCGAIDSDKHYAYWQSDPFDQGPRHLSSYDNGNGSSCGHRDKATLNIDNYNTFARIVGRKVWRKEMWYWPKPADPTPQAPMCEGEPGCLCVPTGYSDDPDGDYLPTTHCPDHQGLATCQTTTVNASQTVGICTLCDETRGAGCPCNDLTAPCDEGVCWGDDTRNEDSATGLCLGQNPPSWQCLADCEELLGSGAFCLHDHPDHARCVPVGTSLPEASNCWWDGGHMDPNELQCTFAPECGVAAGVSCQELGYPSYFVCDATLRCVADVQ